MDLGHGENEKIEDGYLYDELFGNSNVHFFHSWGTSIKTGTADSFLLPVLFKSAITLKKRLFKLTTVLIPLIIVVTFRQSVLVVSGDGLDL